MKKWWYVSMLSCLMAVAATAAPDAAEPEVAPAPEPAALEVPAEPEAISGETEAPEVQAVFTDELPSLELEGSAAGRVEASSGGRIVCTFHCNNGIGALYYCPDSNLGTCCGQAEPACAQNGGLESGICRRGRLGLPCTPL